MKNAERERLARDLHDNVIQTIYAVRLALEHWQRLIQEGEGPPAPRAIAEAVSNLDRASRDIRRFIDGLQVPIISGHQLPSELAEVVRSLGNTIPCSFTVDVDPVAASRLTPEEASHVVGLASEAISNAVRHAGAKNGMISLQMGSAGICFEVQDDGVGFDVDRASCGMGLKNMAARARMMGGQLRILSRSGKGTRIVVDLPGRTLGEQAQGDCEVVHRCLKPGFRFSTKARIPSF